MKDKKSKKISIKDMIEENKIAEPIVDGVDQAQPDNVNEVTPFKFDKEYEEKLIQYNKNIYDLDEDYSRLKPRSEVLVRVFVKELDKTESGLIKPNRQTVMMRTQNGMAPAGTMESVFPYARKAVVVAIPEYITDLTPGDTVLLGKDPVYAMVVGRGDNAQVHIPNSFTHPDFWSQEEPPTDPEDKNYGYLTIEGRDIKFINP